ncbi:MAG: hypothetical protein RML47_02775 [Bacteroidota bacterium]|nr:hypothetical protein [Rhodothermia bacterium]MDW8285010.1 hypothetical protein [Bacteroidota bacterium]
MLTIFACPKPFSDPHIALIQRNAITSWTLLEPRPEIILFGGEPYEQGIREICEELKLRHVPEVRRNEYGTPFLNDLFQKAKELATFDMICYVNADIILIPAFMDVIRMVRDWPKLFLIVGGRVEVEIKDLIDYKKGWERDLLNRATKYKFSYIEKGGIDYFVFKKHLYSDIPDILIGRFWWDDWFPYKAKKLGADIINATPYAPAVHQNHSRIYIHDSEIENNKKVCNSENFLLLIRSTHIITHKGIKKLRAVELKHSILSSLYHFVVYTLGPIRHAIGLRRESLTRVLNILKK